MALFGEGGLDSRRVPYLALFLALVAVLAFVTATCLWMDVEHEFSGAEIHRGRVIAYVYLPPRCQLWPGQCDFEFFEDGRPMEPRVSEPREIRKAGGGAFVLRPRGWQRSSVLHFSAFDGSDPRQNGRHYVVRYPRRQLAGSIALLLAAWVLLPWAAIRAWRARSVPALLGTPVDAAAWAVVVAGAVYSLFAVRAWLSPSSVPWLVGVAAVGLPALLATLGTERRPLPLWFWWLAGALVWAACTAVGGSSYTSSRTLLRIGLISAWGFLLYRAFRGVLHRQGRRGSVLLGGLFLFTCTLSLARDAGFDVAGRLASLGLGPTWPVKLVNPWTTKFLGHWLLALAWSSLVALGGKHGGGRRGVVVVSGLGLLTIAVNGSHSALGALLVSGVTAVAALRWPRLVRRLTVYGLAAAVLLAPLLAAVPFWTRTALDDHLCNRALDILDVDHRGGQWEFARRLIALRPLSGWGIGASGNLPGRDLPIEEALGLPPGAPSPLDSYGALAGGHPHNAALLTWLDLGVVGALLLAGLVAAAGRSIVPLEEQRARHAALLGLLTATAVHLAFNYPLWEPEVGSVVWMSAVLAAAGLPPVSATRRRALRTGAAVLLVLSIGCTALALERLPRWLTVRDLRGADLVFDAEAWRLERGEESEVLDHDPSLKGAARLVGRGPEAPALIQGWIVDAEGRKSPKEVLVFVGSELVGVVWPERPSPEAFSQAEGRDLRALTAGFEVAVAPGAVDLRAPVILVALGREGARAIELPPLAGEPR